MKRWLSRVMLVGVVTLSGMTGPVVSVHAGPTPEVSVSDDWEIAVFLCTPSSYGCRKRYATAKQRSDVEMFLKATPEVTEVRFVSRASAYASFRREFAGQKKVLASVRARDLPESFRVRVSGVADRVRIAALANRRSGVGFVIDQAESHVGAAALSEETEIAVLLCQKDSAWRACRQGRGKTAGLAVTANERKAIVAVIERIPGLESYEYEDQATAYRNFVEEYADNEVLMSATRVSDMSESYRLSMRPEADWDTPIRRLARMSGVSRVSDRRCQLRDVRFWSEYGLQRSSCEEVPWMMSHRVV